MLTFSDGLRLGNGSGQKTRPAEVDLTAVADPRYMNERL